MCVGKRLFGNRILTSNSMFSNFFEIAACKLYASFDIILRVIYFGEFNISINSGET